MKPRGFTLIEIVLVIALIAILGSLSIPVTIGMYNTQIAKSVSDEIFSAFKKAQGYSLYRRDDSEWGVAFPDGEDTFVLFKGNAYNVSDDFNEVSNLQGISVDFGDTIDEIYFEKGTGAPKDGLNDWSGTITLTKGNVVEYVSVCESRLIEFGPDC